MAGAAWRSIPPHSPTEPRVMQPPQCRSPDPTPRCRSGCPDATPLPLSAGPHPGASCAPRSLLPFVRCRCRDAGTGTSEPPPSLPSRPPQLGLRPPEPSSSPCCTCRPLERGQNSTRCTNRRILRMLRAAAGLKHRGAWPGRPRPPPLLRPPGGKNGGEAGLGGGWRGPSRAARSAPPQRSRLGTARPGPARLGAAPPGSARGGARSSAAARGGGGLSPGSVRLGMARYGSVRHG